MRFGWEFMLTLYSSFVVSFGYDNLSSFKKATQSSRNNDTTASPARAVDKEIKTCSSTGADNPAWWYVDLEERKSIHDIQIIFNGTGTADEHVEKQQRELMYGYQLYVSNTTDINSLDSLHHCYNHSGPALPDLISNHVCTTFGRYVIFYNERIPGVTYPDFNGVIKNFTYVQLCEIIVNGCDIPGTYGNYCVKRCPSKCQERRCHIVNGTCSGCTEGWKGDKCEYQCREGYYGLECRSICSNNCLDNKTCNHETGNCDNGCSDGWTGGRCNITCTMGTYGAGCSQNCSGNCKNGSSCNRVTGFCDNGCSPGYTSEKCDQVCTPGTYGLEHFRNCSGNCVNGTVCNATTGMCFSGCSPGYLGKRCDQECPVGTFGEDCSRNCSRNCIINKMCNNVDGRCQNGCRAGFQGVLCEKSARCDHVNGKCICKQGWKGSYCSTECSVGTFGENCLRNCSGNCSNNETCSNTNGICRNGCQSNYKGLTCHELNKKEQESDTSGTIAGLASVLGISLLLNGAFIVFLFYRFTRKTPPKSNYENSELSEPRTTRQETQEANVYQELQHENHPIQTYQNLSYNN